MRDILNRLLKLPLSEVFGGLTFVTLLLVISSALGGWFLP